MFVCLCKAVTDHEIHEAVDRGIQDLHQLEELCGAGSGCGCCRETAQQIIDARLRGGAGHGRLAESRSYAA